MDHRRVAPYSYSPSEQLRIDEVRYLHSLWRQGPPRNPNPNNNNNLRPNNPTIFKKKKKKNRGGGRSRNGHNNGNEEEQEEEESPGLEPVSEVEWPTEPIPEPRDETDWSWPDSVPQPDSTSIKEVSAEEQEKIKGIQAQNQALKASKKFLSRNFGSDSEGEDFMEDDNNGDDDDGEESEEFEFFFNLFSEDEELRNYYDKNWEGGDFPCFVCGASGRKCRKRFKTCVSLVHHSTSISNTKQKKAHRAFGQVLCRVMGWEFNRLPTIVLSADDHLSRILAQASTSQVANDENGNKVVGSVKADIAGGDVNGNSAESQKDIKKSDVNDQHKEEFNDVTAKPATNVDGDSANCEVGTKENDANDQQKALDHKEVVDTTAANNGDVIVSNVSSSKDGIAQQDQDFQKEIIKSEGEANEELVNKDGAAHQEQDFQKELVNTGVEGK